MDNSDILVQIAQMLEDHTRRIEIKIENDVTAHLKALSDGYSANYDKLGDHDKRIERLEEHAGITA